MHRVHVFSYLIENKAFKAKKCTGTIFSISLSFAKSYEKPRGAVTNTFFIIHLDENTLGLFFGCLFIFIAALGEKWCAPLFYFDGR